MRHRLWDTPSIPPLRQVDHEFESRLGHIAKLFSRKQIQSTKIVGCVFFLMNLQIFKHRYFHFCCVYRLLLHLLVQIVSLFMFSNCLLTLSSWSHIVLTVENLAVYNMFILFIIPQAVIGLFVSVGTFVLDLCFHILCLSVLLAIISGKLFAAY